MDISYLGLILRFVPHILVITLLGLAIYYFYTLYVAKARELSKTLIWITDIVRTMRSGAPDTRQAGLAKIFKNTILENNWVEFSRTLHEQYEVLEGRSRLKKHRLTVPSNYFFTPASIIDKQLRVNYFKHLPGLLTSIGIIGTFSGLLYGLSTFDATSPERINLSVGSLLSGVRDAFYASAFAITLAMVVTHVEKLFYQRCLSRLEDLNDAINAMFDGGVYEEYMAIIASSASSSARNRSLPEPIRAPSVSTSNINLGDQLDQLLKPLFEHLEDAQRQMAINTTKSIEKAFDAANAKLASQIESALQRHVRVPIDGLGAKISRSASTQATEGTKERLKKIIQEQGQSVDGTDDGSSRVA